MSMDPGYPRAIAIGLVVGIALNVTYLAFAAVGFLGGLFVPFLSCGTTCLQLFIAIIFLVGAGALTAMTTGACRGPGTTRASAVAGLVASVVGQATSFLISLLISVAAAVIGAIAGYLVAGGTHNQLLTAALVSVGAFSLSIAIGVCESILFAIMGALLGALGGVAYVRMAEKQGVRA